jgi:hypothetical protein
MEWSAPMTDPTHTENAVKDLTREFEEGRYHPDNAGTDLQDMGGPSVREVAAIIAPAAIRDLAENASRSTHDTPEPTDNPFV